MRYRIWRRATNAVHLQMNVACSQGDGKYVANGIYILSVLSGMRTTVRRNDDGTAVAKDFILHQNYPNPFNPSTTIRHSLAHANHVSIKIFNLAGQHIATLVDGRQNAGEHQIQWQAQGVPSGVYFYQLWAGDHIETRKMILMR